MPASLHILYASTSGHTEFVVETLRDFLHARKPDLSVEVLRIEKAQAEDLTKGDVLILASSTWNTGGPEGQLNPHMHAFVTGRAKDAKLGGKTVAVIGLGDDRYHYTCRAAEHLENFVKGHGGKLLEPTLRIINEPYGQEDVVQEWGSGLLKFLKK